ncbi:WGR and DUF4132 domain-containing protein [Massilia rubra]|uniref:DUF4132 domain-containing protein n=1 Tax=Massilia rubra TaxID=2607910 RepID=A0ABX0LZ23_9BURK|nr:DUF4132 domain-containing protein [Massilia rubra]NHZ36604.1 DUF4132 domain-containing protein [Massilia rubra]
MRRFECCEGASNKFWEVGQDGCDVHVRYGKVGTAGQGQTKTHPDHATAVAAIDKLIREKTGKGYAETGAAPPLAAAPPAPPAPAAPPAPLRIAVPGGVAPWLAVEPLVDISPELAALAMPSRRFPGIARAIDAGACWNDFKLVTRDCTFSAELSDPVYRAAVSETIERIAHDRRRGSPMSDAIMMLLEAKTGSGYDEVHTSAFTDFLVSDRGLPYAVAVYLQRLGMVLDQERDPSGLAYAISADVDNSGYSWLNGGYREVDMLLREHLAQAREEDWNECVRSMRQAAPSLPDWRRPLLAILLPDAPDLANELTLGTQSPEGQPPAPWFEQYEWFKAYASSDAALKALRRWPKAASCGEYHIGSSARHAATVVRDRGAGAVALLAPHAIYKEASDALSCIGTYEAMTALALETLGKSYSSARFDAAAARWPQAAMAVLSELIARDGCGPHFARCALAQVLATSAHMVPAFKPWLSAGAWKVLSNAAARYLAVPDIADAADLPPVLVNPPWKNPSKKSTHAAALALAPMPLAPVERWSAQQREQLGKETRHVHYHGPATPFADAAIAAGDADALIAAWHASTGSYHPPEQGARLIAALPAPLNAQVWNALATTDINHPACAIAATGLAGLPALVLLVAQQPVDNLAYALHFGAVELAAPVARAYAMPKPKKMIASARNWLLRNPEHAACGLAAAALGEAGAPREQARQALRMLAGAGHDGVLMDVAARYGDAAVTDAMRAMLDEDPLTLHPSKIGKLPSFWDPLGWTRPLLSSNGKALPDTALDIIGAMLRFPHTDRIYAGVTQLKQACTPDSLADFAWELFRAWVERGGDTKENWAFYALGMLGNDNSARMLAPLVRAWPGESLNARAVVGLDVLAMIGSDTALMLLHGIAQKVKFNALRYHAYDKISEIAASLELSTEELEDRLVPDLDLDEHGEMQLDFGPRQFRVVFDEALKPCLRDAQGARLDELPKPKKTDDAELAAAAVARYKLLKKDARSIAAQQVLRLEQAMCGRRRWTAQAFRDFLAGHPLLRYLVQRLVWGAYDGDGKLLASFRVAPDGGYTDHADDAFALAPGDAIRIGIPHPLEFDPAVLAAFAQLFADYELLQPFAQLARDTHTLTQAERDGQALARWDGAVVSTGRLLGLVERGWHRNIGSGGETVEFSRWFGRGKLAHLHIAPGLTAGFIHGDEVQTLVRLVLEHYRVEEDARLSALDPIDVSEFIRVMEQLCA